MDSELDKFHADSTQSTKDFSNLMLKETIEVDKLKNTWIAQLITLASSLLSGFSIIKGNPNWIAVVGFLILFTTITIGLITILKNLESRNNLMIQAFAKQVDFHTHLSFMIYCEKKGIENLTKEELEQKSLIEPEFISLIQETGLVDNKGNLSSLSGKMGSDKVNVANYILIVGFVLGGILITLSEKLILINFCTCK